MINGLHYLARSSGPESVFYNPLTEFIRNVIDLIKIKVTFTPIVGLSTVVVGTITNVISNENDYTILSILLKTST